MKNTVVTLTVNPAIDKSTKVKSLVSEHKLRCEEPVYEPGGGGINVSRALKRLGTSSSAIFPAGGKNKQLLQELLEKEGVTYAAVPIRNETRENFTVVDSSNNQQYRFVMPGPFISREEIEEISRIVKNSSPGWLVLSGSLSPGVPSSFFADIAASIKKSGTKIIVDTSGEALRESVNEGVYLLKPNIGELSMLIGIEKPDDKTIEDSAKELIAKGKCEVIVVSLGSRGAFLITKNDIEHIPSPAVKKLSSVGAGDSMVAGIVHTLSNGKSLREAVRMGIACGTAAIMNPGTSLFKTEDAEMIYQRISK